MAEPTPCRPVLVPVARLAAPRRTRSWLNWRTPPTHGIGRRAAKLRATQRKAKTGQPQR